MVELLAVLLKTAFLHFELQNCGSNFPIVPGSLSTLTSIPRGVRVFVNNSSEWRRRTGASTGDAMGLVLIHEMYELGVDPVFWNKESVTSLPV
jgi:hypothetical protein